MDLDRLEFEITELLTERNLTTLKHTADKELVRQFVETLLETARPLPPRQLHPLLARVLGLADEFTRRKAVEFLQAHRWQNRWDSYKLVVAMAAAVILCLLTYFFAR